MIDELDARLIELLTRRPRVGVLEASRRLAVARGTVQARLDRLQARGVRTFRTDALGATSFYLDGTSVSAELLAGR